jgi:antitoxin MazE
MSGRISRWGNSAAVRIPKEVLEQAGLREGQSVEFSSRDGIVEVRRRRPSIKELFAEYEEKYGPLEPPEPIDWGPDVGAEVIDDAYSRGEITLDDILSGKARSKRR